MADYFTDPSFNVWLLSPWKTDTAVDQSANIQMISRTQLSTFDASFTQADFTTLFSYKSSASDVSGQYYNYITQEQISVLGETQIPLLSPQAVAYFFKQDCFFSETQIGWLTPGNTLVDSSNVTIDASNQLYKVSAADIAERFVQLTTGQIQHLNYVDASNGTSYLEQLSKISPLNVRQRWSDFADNEVKYLTGSGQLEMLSGSDISGNHTNFLSKTQIQSLRNDQVHGWLQSQYVAQAVKFTSVQVAYLIEHDTANFCTSSVISQLIGSSNPLVNQFASASAVDISNIFQDMIATQVPFLTYGSDGSIDQLVHLGPVIHSLTIPQAGSNDDKLLAFTPEQVAHMFGKFNGQLPDAVYPRESRHYLSYISPSSQLTSLNAMQIWADFETTQSSLTSEQFQSLSYDNSGSQMDQLQGLTAVQVANGTTIDASNIFQILTPAQKRSLSDGSSAFNQLSKLSAIQVATFFPDSREAYYNSSTPISDASNGFTPSQIRHLTDVSGAGIINQLSDLTAAKVAACVDASGYLYFTLDQIRTLRYTTTAEGAAQLSAITNASILNVNVTEFSAAQVQYFVLLERLSNADFQALTDGVNGSTYNQLEYLSAADVSNNISKLLPRQIPQLSCIGSTSLTDPSPLAPNVDSTTKLVIGSQLRCLSPSQINTYWMSFSPMQIASLRADQLSALSAENIQSITQAQVFSIWSSLTQTQVQQLTWGQLNASSVPTINQLELLSGPQVALKISYFAPNQIPHLNNKPDCGILQLADLTAEQIAKTYPSPSTLGPLFSLFTKDQIQTLTYKPNGGQLFKLIATQVRDRWLDFTADQIQSFTPHQVTSVLSVDVQNSFLLFTPQQVAALLPGQLIDKKLADEAIAAAAAAALAILTAANAAAASLAASYITMTEASFNQISPTTFGLMQPEILYQIPSNLINSMTSDQIAGLTPEGIVAVSRYLTQPQVAGWAGFNVPATIPPSYPIMLGNGTLLNGSNPVYADSSGTIIFYGDETSSVYAGISAIQIAAICAIPTTITGTPTQFYTNTTTPIDGLTPQYTNFFTIKNLAPSFISYLTTDAFNAWESSALAEFTQAQAMYITSQQYTLLDDGNTSIEQKRLIINQILLNDITPINFDLVGLNTDAVAPLLFSDKLYEPKLGVYDAEVQVHMDIVAARKFIQYKFSSASDPYSVPSGDGNAGDVHLYLDKTQFMTGVNRGASLTDLSVGVTLHEYRAYDFSNNISAFTPDNTPDTQYNLDWNGNVINNSMSKDPNVSMSVDMIQYIAQQTFGRWMAYNLFNDQESQNERLQLNINRAINHTIRPILDSYDMHTGTYMESPDNEDNIWPVRNTLHVQKYLDLSSNALDATGSAGVYYTKLDSVIDSSGIDQTAKSDETSNIPSCIFDIMYQNQPQRFKSQINTNLFQRTTLNSNVPQTLMTMPFVQGDKLRFICTCNTDPNQYTLDNTSGPPVSLTGTTYAPIPSTNMQITPRRYLVSIVLDDICECPDDQ